MSSATSDVKDIRLSTLVNPSERQREFREATKRAKFVLYGGAAGGGKSYILRWTALAFLIECFGKYGVRNVNFGLFCEDYPTLQDRQISRIAHEFPSELGTLKETRADGYAFRLHEGLGGGRLLLRNLDDPSKYNSTEFAGIAVDELTRNPETVFEELRKRLRWPGFPDNFIFPFWGATNPGGIGHAWVRRLWIDRDFYPEIKPYADQFVFIPAKATDNPHNPPGYYRDLLSLKDPQMRRAMAEGDWDLFVGQFFSEWRREKHVCKPFAIPSYWKKWTAADWGYANPACCLWFARDPDGRTYIYRESYLTQVRTPELGRRWRASSKGEELWARFLDPACWDDSRGKSIQQEFQEAGWPCLKASNDRISGWNRFRSALAWKDDETGQEFEPELQVFETCENFIRTVPAQVYDDKKPEDMDTDGEDHAADAGRYGLNAVSPRYSHLPVEAMPEEYAEAQRRLEHRSN